MKKLKVASFFAGIGGFDLGFEAAGFEVNFQCEIHRFCRIVLKQHWPNVPLEKDITTVQPDAIPTADVWCGGFPCQDLSVARGSNGREGLSGARSGLFFRIIELAKIKKPRVILIENVHGLLNSNNGRDFAELLRTLGELNYAVSWRLLNSRYFGIPQSRPRVYICAWLNNPIAAGNVLFEDRPPMPIKNERSAFLEPSTNEGIGPIVPKLAFCLAATSGRHTGTDWSRTYIAYKDAVRRLTPLECERLQGFPDGWTATEQALTNTELSDSHRYHAIGNAVSVDVISWIAHRISHEFQVSKAHRPKKYNQSLFLAEAIERWPGLSGSALIAAELDSFSEDEKKIIWPNAGVLWNNTFVANHTPPSISNPKTTELISIIESNRPDQRYFLSANAAEGILRRVDSQGRHLFRPLRSSLERLAGQVPKPELNEPTHPQCELDFSDIVCALP